MSKTFKVEVRKDHLSKVSRANSYQAMAEMIWNGLDADASSIELLLKEGEFGLYEIIIRDNGKGFEYEKAESLFGYLGGSWKALSAKTEEGRLLHGQEGQGRFKAFALGRSVAWRVVFLKDKQHYKFEIKGFAENIGEFEISEPTEVPPEKTGVTVTIADLHNSTQGISAEKVETNLLPIFALYLKDYPQARVYVQGKKLDPHEVINREISYEMPLVTYQGEEYQSTLDIVEWNGIENKELFYSDSNGFPLEQYNRQIRGTGDFGFSAYLKSPLLRKMFNEGTLGLGELDPTLKELSNNATDSIKQYFLDRTAEEAQTELDKWKEDKLYPYRAPPSNPVEEAERKIFDIVAVNIKRGLPDFDKSDSKSKAFQLRMLRQAVEKSPEELQLIINEVLQLPKAKQNQLAELLQEVSLTSIISASKLVADRLKFVSGLEELLFGDNYKKHLKERSQLHRILAENTWLFGDSFSMSVDDQSLTEVLRKHAEKSKIGSVINSPVKRIDNRIGIVDLMLSRSIPRNHSDELEHLVVELKAPKVVIGEEEIQQIKSYAFAVAKDERFRSIHTRWHFWIISNDYDDYAEIELDQKNYEDGVIFKSDKKVNLTIWVKTWSQLIQENKHRLNFIQEKLNYNIDKSDAVAYLKDTYAEFTKGLYIEEPSKDEKPDEIPA